MGRGVGRGATPESMADQLVAGVPRGGERGLYDEAMGVDIIWVSFDTGTAMSAAMASEVLPLARASRVRPMRINVTIMAAASK